MLRELLHSVCLLKAEINTLCSAKFRAMLNRQGKGKVVGLVIGLFADEFKKKM